MATDIKKIGLPEALAVNEIYKFGGVKSRINNYFSAIPESNYTPGQIIKLQYPMELIDSRSHSLEFTITGTPATGATYTRFNKDIRSIISRMVIKFGGKSVYDTTNQNLLFNIIDGTYDYNWEDTAGLIALGTGNAAQRNADFINPNRIYSVQLYGLSQEFLNKVLPLNKLQVQMTVELTLADPSVCIETDGTNPSYTVNNVRMHYASLVPDDNWNNMYNNKVSAGINYNYLSFENFTTSTLLPAGTQSSSAILTFRYTSLIAIILVMRPTANINNLASNDKLNTFDYNNLGVAQVKIGGYNQPQDRQRNVPDSLQMYCETFNLSMRSAFISATNFGSTSYVLCIPLSKHPREWNDSYGSISGINTSIANNIVFDLQFNTPLAANMTVDFYALSEQSVIFNANGSISWYT